MRVREPWRGMAEPGPGRRGPWRIGIVTDSKPNKMKDGEERKVKRPK